MRPGNVALRVTVPPFAVTYSSSRAPRSAANGPRPYSSTHSSDAPAPPVTTSPTTTSEETGQPAAAAATVRCLRTRVAARGVRPVARLLTSSTTNRTARSGTSSRPERAQRHTRTSRRDTGRRRMAGFPRTMAGATYHRLHWSARRLRYHPRLPRPCPSPGGVTPLARAKNTDRAEARRRTREQQRVEHELQTATWPPSDARPWRSIPAPSMGDGDAQLLRMPNIRRGPPDRARTCSSTPRSCGSRSSRCSPRSSWRCC